MTFRDYIGAIAKFVNGSQPQLIVDLFKEAGAIKDVEISTASSWIRCEGSKGYRKCMIRNYFPNDTLKEKFFIKYISSRVSIAWKELQESFRSINDDKLVDVDTDKQDLFYWSLLNQFQKIHGLPLSEKPVTSASDTTNNQNIDASSNRITGKGPVVNDKGRNGPQKNSQPERMLDVCRQCFDGFPIKAFIDSDPTNPFASHFEEDVKCFINRIKFNQNRKDILDKDEVIFQTIISFTDLLSKYFEYLFGQMKEEHIFWNDGPNSYRVYYSPPENDNGKFKKETDHYREKLKSLYNEIMLSIQNK